MRSGKPRKVPLSESSKTSGLVIPSLKSRRLDLGKHAFKYRPCPQTERETKAPRKSPHCPAQSCARRSMRRCNRLRRCRGCRPRSTSVSKLGAGASAAGERGHGSSLLRSSICFASASMLSSCRNFSGKPSYRVVQYPAYILARPGSCAGAAHRGCRAQSSAF